MKRTPLARKTELKRKQPMARKPIAAGGVSNTWHSLNLNRAATAKALAATLTTLSVFTGDYPDTA